MPLDLHRHTEYSNYDGFGKPREIAQYAKSIGYTSLGISDHGNTNGLIQHYFGCKEAGIKPILGVEAYFLPVLKEKTRGYHLCLFAKNKQGYANLNHLQTIGEQQKYYNPIITFKDLEKYSEGIICTSACIASFMSQAIIKGNRDKAMAALVRFQQIFGDDFYIEIQPYKCDNDLTQEYVNETLMIFADKLDIKCILTSDSHYPSKEEFETYMMMHKIAEHNKMDIQATYSQRYMPIPGQIERRFLAMHKAYFDGDKDRALAYVLKLNDNLQEIEDKVDGDILDQLEEILPNYDIPDSLTSVSYCILLMKQNLKARGKWTNQYRDRVVEELRVIDAQGYVDYFLMVSDYVNWARKQGIAVGPGRGSACNSIVCYALGITDVDSIMFNLDFNRFMRLGKKKMPDIDVDFETSRRGEVIKYIVDKYEGYSAQICSYGLYKIDNLVNDLVKQYDGIDTNTITHIKKIIKSYEDSEDINFEALLRDKDANMYNRIYPNIINHFTKLYKKVKYIGTHAAGVAVSGNPIVEYTALRLDKETGKVFTNYDLVDIEQIGVIKFDILGLKTEEELSELRKLTGKSFEDSWISDKRVLEAFATGETDGIFQFEKTTPKRILNDINCDCFDDVIAVNAMNRPAMLNLKMDKRYKDAKLNNTIDKKSPYYKYVEETYGCIIYQEQVLRLAINIGGFTEDEADILVKMEHGASSRTKQELDSKYYSDFMKKFITNAVAKGVNKDEAKDLFLACAQYGFNKGHATAYSLIAVEEMWYKLNYPIEFWAAKIKHENKDANKAKFKSIAVSTGALVFFPHVNYKAETYVRLIEGEKVIQEGLLEIKGIGKKAADFIEAERNKNGPFTSKEDFETRCKNRAVTSRVITILKEIGALEFNEEIYLQRNVKYNTALYSRGMK